MTDDGAMDVNELLLELYDRIPEHVRDAADGLIPEELTTAPEPDSNTVGWLIWHLTRVEDHHLSEILDTDQVWQQGDWAARFGLDPDPNNTGYGHRPSDVEAVRPESADTLIEYYDTVAERTRTYIGQLTPADLAKVIDDRWDPPVTLGVRLVSVADDAIQHAGQAKYVRGLLDRR